MKNHLFAGLALTFLSALNSQLPTCFAQGTAFTYQGRVTNNGTNFTGTGQFEFALVTSTNASKTATATANAPSGGFITGYAVTFGGNGYVAAPAVTISGGGGSGAAATANISSGGAVTNISVNNPGNGLYTSAPTVTIAPPPPNIAYTTYWSNDGTSVNGSEPSAAVNVVVNNGLFTVVLGDTTQPNMTAISASLFNQPNLQLRIWFNDGVHGFAALDPAQNLTPAPYAVVATELSGGFTVQANNTNGAPNVIGGSSVNFVSSSVIGATIAGGGAMDFLGVQYINSATADFTTVSGGMQNTAGDYWATVGGGYDNIASGNGSTVTGGVGNTASGVNATVPGGVDNTASGDYSFAAGTGGQALHYGSFVWSDNSAGYFASTANNQFSVRAAGGILFAGDVQLSGGASYHNLSLSGGNSLGYLYGSYPYFGDGVHLSYNFYADASGTGHVPDAGGGTSRVTAAFGEVILAVGGVNVGPNTVRLDATTAGVAVYGTFNNSSDRNVKQGFTPVSSLKILDEVLRLPVSEWSYKDDPTTRHIGPMGQDFYSVFKIGTDEKHIAPIDEGGVAFAAIQALNQKLEEQRAENAELKQRLEALEKIILNRKSN